MTRILEQSQKRIVIESNPKFAFGIAILLGVLATVGATIGLLDRSSGISSNDIFGIILGPIVLLGSIFLYRKTVTVLDINSGLMHWNQRGLIMNKSEQARLVDILDVVRGRPTSDQGGGPTCLVLVLTDRRLPLSFGFSSLNSSDNKIIESIKNFIRAAAP